MAINPRPVVVSRHRNASWVGNEQRGQTMAAKATRATRSTRTPPKKLSTAELDALIAEATVDAYGESEQATGFYTMFEEYLALPFKTQLLGIPVTVEGIDMTDDEQIVAVCVRGRSRQKIRILELPMPDPPPAGWTWVEAYRRWARWMS
jgi:hypothetical protein